jgi:hypothetical protein
MSQVLSIRKYQYRALDSSWWQLQPPISLSLSPCPPVGSHFLGHLTYHSNIPFHLNSLPNPINLINKMTLTCAHGSSHLEFPSGRLWSKQADHCMDCPAFTNPLHLRNFISQVVPKLGGIEKRRLEYGGRSYRQDWHLVYIKLGITS